MKCGSRSYGMSSTPGMNSRRGAIRSFWKERNRTGRKNKSLKRRTGRDLNTCCHRRGNGTGRNRSLRRRRNGREWNKTARRTEKRSSPKAGKKRNGWKVKSFSTRNKGTKRAGNKNSCFRSRNQRGSWDMRRRVRKPGRSCPTIPGSRFPRNIP